MRKDEYSPGLFDSVASRVTGQESAADKKERAELEQRMAKLETDLKQRKTPPQAAAHVSPPVQTTAFPSATRSMGPVPAVSFCLSLAKDAEARALPAAGRHDQL